MQMMQFFYAPAKTPEQAAEVLSACMSEVSQWLIQNKLILNYTKTAGMCFSIKKHNLEQNFKYICKIIKYNQ